jgi:hypothetical protein
MRDAERAAALLETAQRHLRTVQVAIDQLALLEADAELHALCVRLFDMAFTSDPESMRRDMEDTP